MSTIKSILVTREPGSFKTLKQQCINHNIRIKEIPFIEVEAVLDVSIPSTDWIFFSSPKGAQSYLAHYFIVSEKIAAIGEGTASVLQESGYDVHFIGESDDDPSIIGQKFNQRIKANSTVFFPLGNRSKRSVTSEVNPLQVKECITYKTIDRQQKLIENFDAILFTSPSNFHSFIQSNDIDSNTCVIAIGKTTEKAINTYSPKFKVNTLKSPTENAIIEFLTS